MKKNRRHELQTNILADRLGGLITRFRPYIKLTGIVILVAAVIAGGWAWRERAKSQKRAAIWQEFLAVSIESASSLSDLLTLAATARDFMTLQLRPYQAAACGCIAGATLVLSGLSAAVGINMLFLYPYSLRARGWGRGGRPPSAK